jgi:C-terminal peptidase prc
LTGNERAVVDEIAGGLSPPRHPHTFANDLDRAVYALQSKASPSLKPSAVACIAVDAVCDESQRLSGQRIERSQRDAWIDSAERTGSFERMLHALEGFADMKRSSLVDVGLKAICDGPARGKAWLVSGPAAKQLKAVMSLRKQEDPGVAGLKLDRWPLVSVVPDMPAAEAGIRDGDAIVAVNGIDAASAGTTNDAMKLLAGPAGQEVTVAVERGGRRTEFRLRRIPRAAACVTARPIGRDLLIHIPTLEGEGIADRVAGLVRRLPEGAAVLIDLRDNSGGRPEQANGIADLFLDSKILEMFRFREASVAFRSHPGAVRATVVVLTNGQTGSAAEMLAMALRDNGVATIVGEPTAGMLFGKDIEELEDGRLLVIRVQPTVLSPNGDDYSANGIPPDVAVADARTTESDAILERAAGLAVKSRQQPHAGANP